jgi:hypothetical protein
MNGGEGMATGRIGLRQQNTLAGHHSCKASPIDKAK